MSNHKPLAHVIGDPIAQSKSPLIHGFWLEKLGAAGSYQAHHVLAGGVGAYLDEAKVDASWQGCNVTMPHKQEVMKHLESVDDLVRRVGAVNTVYRDGSDDLVGTNTDVDGFLEPLKSELENQHYFRMARILGTGGAARAIIVALADQGFTLVVAGRDPQKARALLDELAPKGEHHAVHLSHFSEPTDFAFDDREGCLDLVVNASPLGMTGNPPLQFDWSHAPPGSIAYDIVYSPLETNFLKDAQKAGHKTIDGLSMLIGQAAIASERFFGAAPPREHDAELRRLLVR